MSEPHSELPVPEKHTARIFLDVQIEICVDSYDSPRVLAARVADALHKGNDIPMDEGLPNCLSKDWNYSSDRTIDLHWLLCSQNASAMGKLAVTQYAVNHVKFNPSAENGTTITDEHGNVILQGLP